VCDKARTKKKGKKVGKGKPLWIKKGEGPQQTGRKSPKRSRSKHYVCKGEEKEQLSGHRTSEKKRKGDQNRKQVIISRS